MGFVPPSFPEPWSIIKARWDELERQGKLITMADLDPRFWAWYTRQQRFYSWALPVVGLGAVLLVVCMVLVVATR